VLAACSEEYIPASTCASQRNINNDSTVLYYPYSRIEHSFMYMIPLYWYLSVH